MNKNSRIKLTMSVPDCIINVVDGNPGALRVCMNLLENNELGFADLLHLDDMEIYGSDIWLCYKDICRENLEMLKVKIKDRSIKDELIKLKVKYGY